MQDKMNHFSFSSSCSEDEECGWYPRNHFWGCTLTQSKPIREWSFFNMRSDQSHSLNLIQAVLGKEAVVSQRNIVEVETRSYTKEVIRIPILSLTLGRNDMCAVDISFESEFPVKFHLIEGTGPVHLIAHHVVEYQSEDECTPSEKNVMSSTPRPPVKIEPRIMKTVPKVSSSTVIVKKDRAETLVDQPKSVSFKASSRVTTATKPKPKETKKAAKAKVSSVKARKPKNAEPKQAAKSATSRRRQSCS